jgi:tripartite-type tricarboxylate transporter receptor subunit TctC
MRRTWLAALGVLSVVLVSPVHAQSSKPIKMIVAFPPGGPVDLVARLLTDPLTKEMGQPIVVENKPGANGGIAAELVAKGPADGSVIFLTSSGATVINPSLYPNLPYDPMKDFASVSRVVNSDTVLVVHPSNPASDAAAFADASRKVPQSVPIGSAGIGSTTHLALELFQGASKANLLHVPYKGAGPVINDLIADQIGGFFGDLPGLIGHIQGGKLKPLGIAAPKRHALLPDVKTFTELGFPGTDSNNWYAVVVQAKTPRPFIDKLNAALRTALTTEPVRGKLINAGAVPDPSTPEEMAEVMKRDTEKFARIIKDKNIKAE